MTWLFDLSSGMFEDIKIWEIASTCAVLIMSSVWKRRKKENDMPLPEVSIISPFLCVTQEAGSGLRNRAQGDWLQAACVHSQPAPSQWFLKTQRRQSRTLLTGGLVLFNSFEQLESTQLTTTWAWKCLMIAYKICHAMRSKGNNSIQQNKCAVTVQNM